MVEDIKATVIHKLSNLALKCKLYSDEVVNCFGKSRESRDLNMYPTHPTSSHFAEQICGRDYNVTF